MSPLSTEVRAELRDLRDELQKRHSTLHWLGRHIEKRRLPRRDLQAESLRRRIREEKAWAHAWEPILDRLLISTLQNLDEAFRAAQPTRKSVSFWKLLKAREKLLPATADPARVSQLLDEYRLASRTEKPRIEAQIRGLTGFSPQESSTALMNTLQTYTMPTRDSIQEALDQTPAEEGFGYGPGWFLLDAAQLYIDLGARTSTVAGQTALDYMGINKTFAWATPQNTARDLFAARGSKVIQGVYGEHLTQLSKIIQEATNPRAPLTIAQVEQRIRAEWPKLKAYQVARIARTETAAVWTSTSMNTYAANGVDEWESTIAHGPSIEVAQHQPCPLCVERALAGPFSMHSGDAPPWHASCRCEALPILEDSFGDPWLPPDEPWVGGGDIPVCGTSIAKTAQGRRTRLTRMGARVKKAAQCLTPAPEPGEPFGGFKYERISGELIDEETELAVKALRHDIQTTWVQPGSAEGAEKVIAKLDEAGEYGLGEGYTRQLVVARDSAGHPKSFGVIHEALDDVTNQIAIQVLGIASQSGGARHWLKKIAEDAYGDGTKLVNLTVHLDGVSPKLKEVMEGWGFKHPKSAVSGEIDATRMRIANEGMEKAWGFKSFPDDSPWWIKEGIPDPVPPIEGIGQMARDQLEGVEHSLKNHIIGHEAHLSSLKASHANAVAVARAEETIARLTAQLEDVTKRIEKLPAPPPLPVKETPPSVEAPQTMLNGDAAEAHLLARAMTKDALDPDGMQKVYGAHQRLGKINEALHQRQTRSLLYYTRYDWNDALGPGHGLSEEWHGRMVKQLDSIISGTSHLEQPVTLYQHGGTDLFPKGVPKVGRVANDKGYAMATPHPTDAGYAQPEQFYTTRAVLPSREPIIEMKIPAGMLGIWTKRHLPDHVAPTPTYIMPRGLKWKVTAVEKRTVGGSQRQVITIEPQNAPRPPLKEGEIPATVPEGVRVVPGGLGKEQGTQRVLKGIDEAYRSGGSQGLKKGVMEALTARVKKDPRWNPEALMKAWGFDLSDLRYSADPDERVMAALIRGWAHTSSDADKRGVAVQIAAKEELGMDVRVFAADYRNRPDMDSQVNEQAEALLNEPGVRDALKAFMRAQYEETQARLYALGVDEVTVYRGLRLKPDDVTWEGGAHVRHAEDNPLASWSVKMSVSRRSHFYGGTMLRASVPREMVFATPLTGFGCANEYEVLVMNLGRNDVWIIQEGERSLSPAHIVEVKRRADEAEVALEAMKAEKQKLIEEVQGYMIEAGDTDRLASASSWFSPAGSPHAERVYNIRTRLHEIRAEEGPLQMRAGMLRADAEAGMERWGWKTEAQLKEEIERVLRDNPQLAGQGKAGGIKTAEQRARQKAQAAVTQAKRHFAKEEQARQVAQERLDAFLQEHPAVIGSPDHPYRWRLESYQANLAAYDREIAQLGESLKEKEAILATMPKAERKKPTPKPKIPEPKDIEPAPQPPVPEQVAPPSPPSSKPEPPPAPEPVPVEPVATEPTVVPKPEPPKPPPSKPPTPPKNKWNKPTKLEEMTPEQQAKRKLALANWNIKQTEKKIVAAEAAGKPTEKLQGKLAEWHVKRGEAEVELANVVATVQKQAVRNLRHRLGLK